MAQLGARLNGIQKVSGSIPLGSTKKRRPGYLDIRVFSCFWLAWQVGVEGPSSMVQTVLSDLDA